MKIAVDSVIGSNPLPGPLTTILPAWIQDSGQGLLLFAVGLAVATVMLSRLSSLAIRALFR